jgi:flagellar biosynthesis chaperone FliJ
VKKKSLATLHRYRQHLLEQAQVAIADALAEENNQKVRVLQLRQRIAQTHETKLRATSSADLVAMDEAAAYLHTRVTMAERALTLARGAREQAVARVLELKRERDQAAHLIDRQEYEWQRAQEESERQQLNELATIRHVMAAGKIL